MKKRLLSALLALALVFVLLPTTALAGETTGKDYDISINGKGWKFEKDTPVYFYGYDPSNYFFSTTADHQWTTNSNLMLTKEGNTVTITIRPSKYHPYESPQFTLKKESTSTEKNDVPCIEMGNGNNLVITGKGTLNITRNESKSYGAALYSNVGDITINGGITVNVSFLNGKDYYNKNASSNAIYVGDNHNLTVSGSGTNVTATNQGFDSSPATVCVEGGTITVSGGASLSATNTYADNFSGSSVTQHFKSYAISGTESKPCTLIVADEKSSVTAWAYDEKYGKPFGFVTYNITGATVKAGSSAYYATETNIDNINGKEYVKISVPALETTADVLIAKENAVVGVRTSLGEGNGYYTYNKDTKTLTLEDVSITNVAHFIQFWAKDSYTIELKGTNTITGVTSAIRVPEKGYNNESLDGLNVTITGTGSLNVTANTYAIDMQVGNLIFNSTGNITLTTNTNYTVQKTVCNALHVAGSITIDNTKYDIVGARQEKNYPTETISDSSVFDPDYLNGYTVGGETTLFKTITITPAAAKDSTISYGKKTLKQGEIIKGEISGTATVATKGNTITLNNFKGTQALSFEATLADSTLVLEGTSTLSSIVTTQKGLTISGSGSLTVGSIKVTNNDNIRADLTITGGAHVTVNRPSEDKPAVEVSGNLTVTGDGTQLSAECTAATNPAIEVGGNVTISGNPGTNAYTVKAYNKYATQRGRDDKLRPSQMPSAIEISGDSLSISNSARVMAKTDSDGAAVWMPAQKVISVADASLIAQNRSHNFSTISFGDESNMGNIYAKGQEVNIVAENMLGSNSSLAHRAIKAFIYNHYNTGDSNPYYIKVVSEGVQSGGNVNVIPGHCTSTGGYKVTITRGDAYTTPQVAANYTIAGQTMYVGKYYKTDANGNITDGTAQDYNIYCDSKNDFTLNNATISSTGTGGSTGVIMTNLNYSSAQFHIKLIGTNSINNAGHHAILGEGAYSTIIIENAENASNTSLTISGNFLPVYSFGNVTINAEVVIINTNGNLISTIKDGNANGAFDLGSGYKCYASTDVSGSPLETYDAAKSSTYKYLRVTKENLTPTTPTTYTVTITGENISKYYRSEGELEQTVTAGEAIKTVTVAANGGYYFPDNYVKDLELPSGITATVSGDNWYLTIKGIPSKDATINLPVLSKRPTITVDIPLPVAGNKPATIDQIHLTCDDPNYTPEITGIRWNKGSLTEESVAIGANDTFVAGTCYNVKIFLSSGVADGAYKLAYAGGGDNPWYAYWDTSNFQLYFQATPAATHTHEKGDLQFNSEGHWYKCAADTSCTERIDFASHTYKDNICTVCNYVKPACSHTNLKYIDNNDYETHKVQCADCEEIIAEKEAHDIQGYVIDDAAGTHQAFCNKCHYRGLASHHSIIYVPKDNGHCKACAICKVQLGRVEEHTFENGVCTVCNATSGEIEPPTPDNPGTIVIIRPAEEEKPAQQPNPSTGANDLVGLAVAAAVAAALGSAALLRKHD